MIEINYRTTTAGGRGKVVDLGSFQPTTQDEVKDLLEFVRQNLITISQTAFQDEVQRGFPKDALRLVDGKANKPIERVNYLGKVEYISKVDLREIALEVFDSIEKRSRVESGLYKKFNIVMFRGNQVASTRQELENFFDMQKDIIPGDKIMFINITPYAHMLERMGLSSGRKSEKWRKSTDDKQRSGPKVRKPNGTYALTYTLMRRKLRSRAYLKFELLPANYLQVTDKLPISGPKQKYRATYDPKGKYNSGFYLHPVITLGAAGPGISETRQ